MRTVWLGPGEHAWLDRGNMHGWTGEHAWVDRQTKADPQFQYEWNPVWKESIPETLPSLLFIHIIFFVIDHLRSCLFNTHFSSPPLKPSVSIPNARGSQVVVCLVRLVANRGSARMSGLSSSTDGLGRSTVQAHLCTANPHSPLHR